MNIKRRIFLFVHRKQIAEEARQTAIESAYWEADHLRKQQGYSDRDAFKTAVRLMLNKPEFKP